MKIPKLEDISVNLDDGVFTDRNAELDYWVKALASGIVSKQYAISKVLGVTDEEASKMLNEINEEVHYLDEVDGVSMEIKNNDGNYWIKSKEVEGL